MNSLSARFLARVISFVRGGMTLTSVMVAAVFVVAGLALPGVAAADPVVRTLSGTVGSQATVSGAYSYDPATGFVSNVNVVVTGDGTVPGYTLTSGLKYSGSDIILCTTNPCTVGARYLYMSGAVTATSGSSFDGPCTNVGNTPAGGVGFGCINGNVERYGTYAAVVAPTVTGLAPSAGPAGGGTTVTISGTDFIGVSAVTFGANPATSFTVVNATTITAVAPDLGQQLLGGNTIIADVTVTTALGTSSTSGAADDYSYVGTPSAPEITSLYDGSVISDNTPVVGGSSSHGEQVTVFLDGTSIGNSVVDPQTRTWSRELLTLSEGPHTIHAVATGVGGLSSPSPTITFTVDTVAPPAPVITSPTSGALLQAIGTVSGTAEPNSFVIVYINDGTAPPTVGSPAAGSPQGGQAGPDPDYNTFGTARADASGNWVVERRIDERSVSNGALASTNPLAIGETQVSLYAVARDQADNQSPVSETVILTTDSVAPVTPVAQSPASGATVTTARPIFTGTSEASALITVFVDGSEYGQTYANGAGDWSLGGLPSVSGKPAGAAAAPPAALSAGPHTWSVTAQDASGNVSAPSAPITFNVVLVSIDQTSVPNGAVASAYSQTLTATGGTAPYSFTVTAGALPAGVTLSTGGVLSGTPTAGGNFSFTVTVTDAVSQSASQAFSLSVSAPTIGATTTIPAARRGFAYNQTLTGSGGTGPYSFALDSGTLPAGITLSAAGVLSGTPTVIGSFPIGVRVTDSSTGGGPYSSTVNLTLVVSSAAISVTPTTLPGVMAGLPYDQTMSATGGSGAYSYAITAGALPDGITLTSAGRLAGRSYVVGNASFTITATDAFGNTGAAALILAVLPRPDPSADPDVRGINAAQAEATRRLTGTQIDNFSRRLEDIRRGNTADLSMGVSLQSGLQDMGQQSDPRNRFGGGRMFDRQTVDPDRAALNAMLWQTSDARTGGMGSGQVMGFNSGAASAGGFAGGMTLTGAEAPASGRTLNAVGTDEADPMGGIRFWSGGAITVGDRDAESGQAELSITSSGVSVGADFALSPTVDLGIGGGFGEEHADVGQLDSKVDTSTAVAVIYGSWRPQNGIYVDAMLGYGSLTFDTRRRVTIDNSLVLGDREGTAIFGALGVGYDQPVGAGRLSTYGRLESVNAELDAYTERGSAFWALSYASRDVESLQGVLGGRYVWSSIGRDSIWTPSLRAEFRQELASGGLQTLRYADWMTGPAYEIDQDGWERGELNLGFGLNVQTRSGWTATTEIGGRFSDGQTLGTLRLSLSNRF